MASIINTHSPDIILVVLEYDFPSASVTGSRLGVSEGAWKLLVVGGHTVGSEKRSPGWTPGVVCVC